MGYVVGMNLRSILLSSAPTARNAVVQWNCNYQDKFGSLYLLSAQTWFGDTASLAAGAGSTWPVSAVARFALWSACSLSWSQPQPGEAVEHQPRHWRDGKRENHGQCLWNQSDVWCEAWNVWMASADTQTCWGVRLRDSPWEMSPCELVLLMWSKEAELGTMTHQMRE